MPDKSSNFQSYKKKKPQTRLVRDEWQRTQNERISILSIKKRSCDTPMCRMLYQGPLSAVRETNNSHRQARRPRTRLPQISDEAEMTCSKIDTDVHGQRARAEKMSLLLSSIFCDLLLYRPVSSSWHLSLPQHQSWPGSPFPFGIGPCCSRQRDGPLKSASFHTWWKSSTLEGCRNCRSKEMSRYRHKDLFIASAYVNWREARQSALNR